MRRIAPLKLILVVLGLSTGAVAAGELIDVLVGQRD
jgi:hypothetical protein